MHPALSVIVFTTASGAGYGLLALLGVLAPFNILPAERGFGLAAIGLALLLITGGLLSSTVHLGHPERAWRAVTQWRTSWLSREGVAALVTYVPAGLFALGWIGLERVDGVFAVCGLLAAVMAAVTVYCTGMIYASLKPIQQWCNPHVVPGYLALALMTGALWLNALLALWQQPQTSVAAVAVGALALAAWLKLRYWRFIDTAAPQSTPESALGLAGRGTVRVLDAPHTEANYLLREMGFTVARKHALKLRRLALGIGFALPLLLTVLASLAGGAFGAVAATAAALLATAGILVERWLFFAQAKHTVTLYYGRAAA